MRFWWVSASTLRLLLREVAFLFADSMHLRRSTVRQLPQQFLLDSFDEELLRGD